MKKLIITSMALCLGISSVFAAYQASMTETKQVDAAATVLLQIVDAKHDGNYDLLLGILKGFESKVAGDERKVWILDTLIAATMNKMGMMMKDDTMMDDTMIKDDVMMDDKMMDDKMMDGNHKTFDVSGTNFAFSMNSITVHEGDTVTINFESAEGFHDRVVDEFDAATAKVKAGDGVTSVTFVADAPGTFEYYCSVGSHRAQGMIGNLIVEAKMMNDSHSDTMMDDKMMMDALMPLENVTNSALIRGVQFNGAEIGSASSTTTDAGTQVYATFDNLPDAGADNFYEGRIVRMNGGLSVKSTGALTMKDGMYINEWMIAEDISDHTFYVLTLEPNDNDPAPADHVLEAHVK